MLLTENWKSKRDGSFPSLINGIYKNPAANIISGEKLEAFALMSGIRQGFPLPCASSTLC
jgi:hypothetical protein